MFDFLKRQLYPDMLESPGSLMISFGDISGGIFSDYLLKKDGIFSGQVCREVLFLLKDAVFVSLDLPLPDLVVTVFSRYICIDFSVYISFEK